MGPRKFLALHVSNHTPCAKKLSYSFQNKLDNSFFLSLLSRVSILSQDHVNNLIIHSLSDNLCKAKVNLIFY